MKDGKWLLCIAFCMLAGCSEEREVKTAILANLKDPDSAKIGKITIKKLAGNSARGQELLGTCVPVNAKNGFGGYSGERMAALVKVDGVWQFDDLWKMTEGECAQQLIGIMNKMYHVSERR